jgi:hypothetical protein
MRPCANSDFDDPCYLTFDIPLGVEDACDVICDGDG